MAKRTDHDSLTRLLQLYDQLQGGGRISTRRTPRDLGIGLRTLQRYVGKLETAGVKLEPEDTANDGRVYTIRRDRRVFRSLMPLTEVFALHVALGWLRQFEGAVIFQSLDGLRARLNEWLEARDAQEARKWDAQKFYALPFLPFQYDPEEDVLNDVVSALLKERKLRFRYRTAAGRTATHTVRPYTLVFSKGAFYLIALVDQAKPGYHPTSFHLSRMTASEVLREGYAYPVDWDPRSLAPEMAGLLGGPVEDLDVRFDGRFEKHLREERQWPEGTVVDRPDGRVRLRTRLPLSEELLAWLMGFTPAVEVVSPTWFRERLLARARDLVARHDDPV
jgi:predicted DNA-binding transcriptional regulator YafY